MTPKPLSKEARESCEYFSRDAYSPHSQQLRILLAAEQFWREKFSSMDPVIWDSDYQVYRCEVCEHEQDKLDADHDMQHKPDCAWLLSSL